jgi:D-serine dehydratase
MNRVICGKTIDEWMAENNTIREIALLRETFWSNPLLQKADEAAKNCDFTLNDTLDAGARLQRFAPLIARAFPETCISDGIIESPLRRIPNMEQWLRGKENPAFSGSLLVKCDDHLPISGSVKARGGIYEVLAHAENLALAGGLLKENEDYSVLLDEKSRAFFSGYALAVGSTGNLGLSIGIMGAKLGFRTTVHMSADARLWKKDLLRQKGVTVIEYEGDYSKAVEEGRKTAGSSCHFVDDENSRELFLGYSAAALRLKDQLAGLNITVDGEHPLFVYLPCGVGGGPAGLTFGLKQVFGDYVHCFFAEPTHSPCMILGLITGCHEKVSVYDFGIDNKTCADGLAVGRPSRFAGRIIQPFLSGCYTVEDKHLFRLLKIAADLEGLHLEPSALAGFSGPQMLFGTPEGISYLDTHWGSKNREGITHLIWATGGGMVPPDVMQEYYSQGDSF